METPKSFLVNSQQWGKKVICFLDNYKCLLSESKKLLKGSQIIFQQKLQNWKLMLCQVEVLPRLGRRWAGGGGGDGQWDSVLETPFFSYLLGK